MQTVEDYDKCWFNVEQICLVEIEYLVILSALI